MDWDALSYVLATRGVPCVIEEDVELKLMPGETPSAWVPRPDDDLIAVTISKKDAGFIAELLELRM